MARENDEIGQRLDELCAPTATDIRRAKRAVMEMLDDRAAHRTAALVHAGRARLVEEEPLKLAIEFLEHPRPDSIPESSPTIAYLRALIAGQAAVGSLATEGLIVPALDPPNDERRDDTDITQTIRLRLEHPSGGTSTEVHVARPSLAGAYMATEAAMDSKWYLDPDIFLEELDDLELDDRARRALREALASFRRGLYLAAVSLLGVVSEAAWYRAAERLAKPGGTLAKAVDEGHTARVQKGVAELLRSRGAGSPTTPDELLAQAALLRELRNYGVHPAPSRDDLERFLAEEEAGLLLLRTHRYLVNLTRAVGEAEEAANGSS